MDSAQKNASDMISSLQMKYNRGRQAAITNELVDIITGSFRMITYKVSSQDFFSRRFCPLRTWDDRCVFGRGRYCLEWKTCCHNSIEKQLAFPMVVYDMLIIGSSLWVEQVAVRVSSHGLSSFSSKFRDGDEHSLCALFFRNGSPRCTVPDFRLISPYFSITN
jgi:hypothetical protein